MSRCSKLLDRDAGLDSPQIVQDKLMVGWISQPFGWNNSLF